MGFSCHFECTLIVFIQLYIPWYRDIKSVPLKIQKNKNLGNRQDRKGLEENWTDHKEIYER
jgi:hypothetical protein